MNNRRPNQSPSLRAGAVCDRGMVNVFVESIAKTNVFSRDVNYGVDIKTALLVQAWVNNVAYAKDVWVDLHGSGGDGTLLLARTLQLQYMGPAKEGGDYFLLRDMIHQAGSAGPGWGTSQWRDDRIIQYRLYYQVNNHVYTDGVLHEFEVKSSDDKEKEDIEKLLSDSAGPCRHYDS